MATFSQLCVYYRQKYNRQVSSQNQHGTCIYRLHKSSWALACNNTLLCICHCVDCCNCIWRALWPVGRVCRLIPSLCAMDRWHPRWCIHFRLSAAFCGTKCWSLPVASLPIHLAHTLCLVPASFLPSLVSSRKCYGESRFLHKFYVSLPLSLRHFELGFHWRKKTRRQPSEKTGSEINTKDKCQKLYCIVV